MARFFGAQDMTQGSPWVNLAQFSVPLLLGNIAQQLYNTVDSIVVGRYIGDNALAAVGASMPVINLLLVLFMGISTGAGIMVSQYFGAKEKDHLSKTIGNCLTLTLLSSLLASVLGVWVTHPIMTALDTPAAIYDMACTYMIIIFIGLVTTAFYNIISGILRGLGDSVTPLLFLLVTCGLNIVLDILFVTAFQMGVAGVAWATVISQAVSAVLCIIRLLRMKDVVQVHWDNLKLRKFYSLQVARLGLPSGITQAIFSMAMIVVQALTNSFGEMIIATNVVVMRVDGFAMMPNFTFGMAMTTFAGQNIGAGQLDRVRKGTRDGMKMAVAVAVLLTVCILLFGRYLMALFTDTAAVIAQGQHQMNIIAVGYIAMAVTQVLSGVMRGAGDTMTPMWISLITTVIIRVPVAYFIAYLTRSPEMPNGSADCLYYSLLFSWVLGAVLTGIFFRVGKWRTKGLVGKRTVDGPAAEETP